MNIGMFGTSFGRKEPAIPQFPMVALNQRSEDEVVKTNDGIDVLSTDRTIPMKGDMVSEGIEQNQW